MGKKERKALGKKFKEVYIYADDIDGLNGFDISIVFDKSNTNLLSSILSNRLNNEYERIVNDKSGKYSVKAFIVIKCLVYEQEEDDEKSYKDFQYNASITDIVSRNNINEYIENCINRFFEALTEAYNGSYWRFEKFIKFTIATQKTKSVLGKSYIKLPKAISDKKACTSCAPPAG